jgi:hypothetical protein
MKFFHILLFLTLIFLVQGARARVVINELHYNPAGTMDTTEFIEFWNTGDSSVDLGSWVMSDGVDFTFPPGTSVPAGGFLILAQDPPSFSNAYPGVAAILGPFENDTRLANGGERVALSDSIGTVISEVTYDDAGSWPTAPDGGGPSLELRFPALDPDLPASWSASIPSGGTPGATNSTYLGGAALEYTVTRTPRNPEPGNPVTLTADFSVGIPTNVTVYFYDISGWETVPYAPYTGNSWTCALPAQAEGTWVSYYTVAISSNGLPFRVPQQNNEIYRVSADPLRPGEVIINEIMYNSAVEADVVSYEYVELYNLSGRTVDLAGCVFENNRLPTDTTLLAPGQYAVLADKPWIMSNVYGVVENMIHLDIGLSDAGERLTFYNPNDEVISTVRYDDEDGWPTDADGDGPSLELMHFALDLEQPGSWAASAGFGTPGAANSSVSSETAWSLTAVTVKPEPVIPGQPSWITARLLSSTSLVSLTVYYRTNETAVYSVEMQDDGLHNDGSAGDAEYGAEIPPMPDQAIVWYYFRIELADGTIAELPEMGDLPAPDAPNLTLRLSGSGLRTDVTPAYDWKVYTNSGAATSSRLYMYADREGELLVDDVSITYSGSEHVVNGTFNNNINDWTLTGNHTGSRHEPSYGYTGPGCLRIVSTGVGGSSANSVNQYTNPSLVQDSRQYTLTFACRALPPSAAEREWYFYHVGGLVTAEVCISEINYHTMHDGLGDFEFIELYNYGSQPADITEWTLENDDDIPFRIPEETILPPGGFFVACSDLAAFEEYYDHLQNAAGDLGFTLGNRRDTITLRSWDGTVIDRVSYEDRGQWPVRADGDGATLERIAPSGSGSAATNWQASAGGGTPGGGNGSWGTSILSIRHDPPVPKPTDSVTIYAHVSDPVGIMKVFYHPNEAGAWQSMMMSGPDGNGVYSANLGTFSDRTYVPFYCELSNASSRIRFPTAGVKQPALFEVDNERDTFTLPVFRYIWTDENWNTLSNRRLWDNTDVDVTLILGTQICYNAGVHLRGNYSRSAKAAFNAYLNYGQTYQGHRKVATLNNWEHSSRLAMPFARKMYELAGIPVFDSHPVTLKRRGEQLSLKHYVEPTDEYFLSKHSLPPGNLYKAVQADLQQAMFTFGGYDPDIYEYCYELHASTAPETMYHDLARGLEAMYALPPDVFMAQATQYVDAASFGWERAMYHHLKLGDSWPQWGQNYYLFAQENAPIRILPQDIGSVNWGPWNLFPTVAGVQRIFRHPATFREFWHAFTNFHSGVTRTSIELSYIEDLYDECRNDVDHYFGNTTEFAGQKNDLKNIINSWNNSGGGDNPEGILNYNLLWISQPNRCVLAGQPYVYNARAFDPQDDTITYQIINPPSWLDISPEGRVSGTTDIPGSYTVNMRARNGETTINQSYSVVVQEPEPKVILKFDENHGSTVYDSSGNDNDGSLQNTVTWSADGRYGSCLYFGPNSGDRVYVPSDTSMDIEGDFTFEIWMKFTQKNRAKAYIFEKFEELGFELGVGYSVDGGRMWYGPFDNGSWIQNGLEGHGYILHRYHPDADARLFDPNIWHHIAVTHERDRNEVYVYVNGQRIGGLVWEGNLLGTDPLYIGGSFNGWLDEAKLHSFARKAFNKGISIDAVRFGEPRSYIQLRYFNRGDVPAEPLENYALRIEPSGTWVQLPDINLSPGEEIRIQLDEIDGLAMLPDRGAVALYPFIPDSIYPSGNYEHVCTKILDYVAWGSSDAAPDESHPAVQAGLWQAGGVVDTSIDRSGRITLQEPGRNDRGVISWNNGTMLEAPIPNPVPASNDQALIAFSWSYLPDADKYTVEWSSREDFAEYGTTNVSGTNVVVHLTDGTWFWRVKALYGQKSSAFSYGNSFMVMVSRVIVNLLNPGLPLVYTNSVTLPVDFEVWPASELSQSDIYINNVLAGSSPGSYQFNDGTNPVWVAVVTTGGIHGVSMTNNYVVDREAPTVNSVSPADGILTNLRFVTFTWQANDNYGVDHSELSIDNGMNWFASASGQAVEVPDGTNTWRVRVRDYAGNLSSETAARALYIDASPPYVGTNTLVYPAGGEIMLVGQELTILWQTNHLADAHPVPDPVSLYFSTNASEWLVITNRIDNTGSNTWIIPEWALDTSDCYVRLEAQDQLGNKAEDSHETPFVVIPEPGAAAVCIIMILGIITRRANRKIH